MKSMFRGCYLFNSDLSKWDVSNVENMIYMFEQCKVFNCDLSTWDVRKVKNMRAMFNECFEFEGRGLDKWDVSNIEDIGYMLNKCYKFNTDINNWENLWRASTNNVDRKTIFSYSNKMINKDIIPDWAKRK